MRAYLHKYLCLSMRTYVIFKRKRIGDIQKLSRDISDGAGFPHYIRKRPGLKAGVPGQM